MDGTLVDGLAGRVREIREDRYGPDGAGRLAADLDLPPRTWANYERGVVIPAGVMLRLIDITGADPHWLLTGEGARYTARPAATRRP